MANPVANYVTDAESFAACAKRIAAKKTTILFVSNDSIERAEPEVASHVEAIKQVPSTQTQH